MAAEIPQDISDYNYELWAPMVKTTLTEEGLWDVVENGIPPDPSKIQPEDLSNWRDIVGKNTKAIQILRSSLPDSVFSQRLEIASAKDLWDMMKEADEVRLKISGVNPHYLAMNHMIILLSDSYIDATQELIVMGRQKLRFHRFRQYLDLFETLTMDHTLYEFVKGMKSESLTGFIRWLTSLSDYGAAMEELKNVKNLSFKSFCQFLDIYGSARLDSINGIMKKFEVTSSSFFCYTAKDIWDMLREAKEQSKMVIRSRNERGECVLCGGKWHVFKDCSNRKKKEALPEHELVAYYEGPVTFDEDMWMIYPSTTNHMTPYIKYFTRLDRTHRARINLFVQNSIVMAEGLGDVTIMTNEGKITTIKNVLYVPSFDRNVLSTPQLKQLGYRIQTNMHRCKIKDETGSLFGDSLWEEGRKFFLRLQVIKGNLT